MKKQTLYPYKNIVLLITAFLLLHFNSFAGEKRLALEGSKIGEGWELAASFSPTQPSYINKTIEGSPIVNVTIIKFADSGKARVHVKKRAEHPNYKDYITKLSDTEYEQDVPKLKHRKRYLIFGKHLVTIDQMGTVDHRKLIIQKYKEHFKKLQKS